jgi:carboxyl-terminal processing protease
MALAAPLVEAMPAIKVERKQNPPSPSVAEMPRDAELNGDEVEDVPIEQIRNFIEAFQVIKDNYVDTLSNNTLFENAMSGLAEHLDPYSRYLDAEHYQQLLEFTEGQMAEPQLKLHYQVEQQQWSLSKIVRDSDNYRKGLRDGQVVERLNGVNIQALDERTINNMLAGALGSALSLRVKLDENKVQTLDVLRDQKLNYDIEPYLTDERILVLRIKAFQQDTTTQVQDILKVYQQRTSNIRGVLIDIRDNPGGLLSAAVDLADLFLEQGLIVTTKGRIDPPQKFQAFSSPNPITYPIAILQNRFSASAAEVFAAALKEHQRAIVLGETSYGKGAIQKLFPLQQGALKLTVAYYYTPQGHLIEGKGIRPDEHLNMNQMFTEQQVLQQAMLAFEKTLHH